jgi:hypothetical protein
MPSVKTPASAYATLVAATLIIGAAIADPATVAEKVVGIVVVMDIILYEVVPVGATQSFPVRANPPTLFADVAIAQVASEYVE